MRGYLNEPENLYSRIGVKFQVDIYIYNIHKGKIAPKLLNPQTEISRLYFEKGVSATIKLKSGFPERFDLLHTKESTERRRLVAGEGKILKELGRLFCGGSPPQAQCLEQFIPQMVLS